MGKLEGKVAFITGAARSQGRSHAIRLAQEGADIIAVDLCGPVDTIEMYPPSTEADLAETVKQVEALDRRIVATKADVRDSAALRKAVDDGVAELGRLDIVLGNAGVFEIAPALDITDDAWQNMIDVNLTGVWNTCKVALPHLIAGGRGGSIVLTSSTAGLKGTPNTVHYTATKHGVVGIMRTLANEFGQHSIRVNTVHPTGVDTVMIQNPKTWGLFAPDDPNPSREKSAPIFQTTNTLPVPWIEAIDISNAIAFLVSDDARYITGATLPVDAGYTVK
ncbi:mycofactocin-coupled SDR family oxidoreductase [Rhodococcus sp. IEGM 1401]|uniref:Mycofactocin-coupled SDR family oxidoreductase n=1 Tax=Rhodococcus cerastii TaxID=908616 RepID=A0ABU4CYT6_9NOCA|nr:MULTISPECIES: mycofactocin-coupled SDR family oxidoreductase [Rhodococcus]KAA0927931.1 NAD(P)-dependent oxidoreductase [Rhodococcus sp. ANT_H53B]MCZ4563909.1 mycofactocin-coupled SDR family oxidoreductase [Rhodococcus sp. IEGM 1401]MDI6627824.1 mycofactocin-coupled SDR family oxidoreductase [Rhodococcus sp. (in: high G+C Gram-positive bacteria)]MDI9924031.1 mycofactocin-coupled SDR family oxidoreductase [Rhodococcus sp. IEGM 1372]MDI9925588.1 mycofactocin-coupled SDR family oxidoreductase [